MKVTKWVDFGADVDIYIDLRDVQAAIAEAYERANRDDLDSELPWRADVAQAIVRTISFLKALTDEQIGVLNDIQRKLIADALSEQVGRFMAIMEKTP